MAEALEEFNNEQTFATIQRAADDRVIIKVIKEDVTMVIDKYLQKVLNVAVTSFSTGIYTEPNPIVLSVFRKMNTGKQFELNVYVNSELGKKTAVKILKPTDFSVYGIKNAFNKALYFDHDISMQETGVPNEFKLESDKAKLLILPTAISSLFGTPIDQEFKDGDILGVLQLENHSGDSSGTIAVMCDIISPQLFGSSMKTVLKVIEKPRDYKINFKNMNPIQYVPVASNGFESIRISLKKSTGEAVILNQSSERVVVLHLSPKN